MVKKLFLFIFLLINLSQVLAGDFRISIDNGVEISYSKKMNQIIAWQNEGKRTAMVTKNLDIELYIESAVRWYGTTFRYVTPDSHVIEHLKREITRFEEYMSKK